MSVWPADSVPVAVQHLQEKVQNADAILFAVTERNGSISSPLKNAIDWCSMPNSFEEKPAAMLGVGHGGGTATAQQHLRQVCDPAEATHLFAKFPCNGRP